MNTVHQQALTPSRVLDAAGEQDRGRANLRTRFALAFATVAAVVVLRRPVEPEVFRFLEVVALVGAEGPPRVPRGGRVRARAHRRRGAAAR